MLQAGMKILYLTSVDHPQLRMEAGYLRRYIEVDYLVTDIRKAGIPKATILLLKNFIPCVSSTIRLRIPPFPPKQYFASVLAAATVLERIPKERKYDLVFCQWLFPAGLVGLLISRIKNFKTISVVWGYDIQESSISRKYGINRWSTILLKSIMRKSDVVIANHLIHATIASKIVGNFYSEKVKFVATGIPDLSKELRLPDQKAENLRSDIAKIDPSGIVLYSPSLDPIYGIAELMAAVPAVVQKLPKTLFVVTGEGERKDMFMKIADDMNVTKNVLFVGKVSHTTMLEMYRIAKVVCDLSYYGAGTTTVEAFCFGRPVIGMLLKEASKSKVRMGTLSEKGDSSMLSEKLVAFFGRDTL